MENIQIFLASSIVKFEKEREKINIFVQEIERRLRERRDISLKLIKCENMDNNIVPEGKQAEYDEEIIKSDIVIFLFKDDAGEFTLHELEIAAENMDKERISVMCTEDPYRSKENSLKKLAGMLEKYEIDHRMFSSIEQVKNEIFMKLIVLL